MDRKIPQQRVARATRKAVNIEAPQFLSAVIIL